MLKRIFLFGIVFLIGGCAGIRYCKENELPKKTGCYPWNPSTVTGAVAR